MFLGEFEHALDAKQRLAIPAEFRARWKSEVHGESMVAMPGNNGAIWLWPAKPFERLVSDSMGTFDRDPARARQDQIRFSQSAYLPFDSAGRVRIPDTLLSAFGLKGRVMVLGTFDHLEVMDPEKWAKVKAESKVAADAGAGASPIAATASASNR